VENLTEEGIKAALRRLTENTRKIRYELLGQMRRPTESADNTEAQARSRQLEIRGSGSDDPNNR